MTVKYSSPQTELFILWGTVDTDGSPSDRNVVTSGGTVITGADIAAAYNADGFGTLSNGADDVFVEITGLTAFSTATFTDDNKASFEFGLGIPTATPLPAALPLFAGGLGVMGLLGRRRKRKALEAGAAA